MTDPISWSLVINAIKTGKTVFDEKQRKTLATKFKLLIRSNRKIAVFGISGTGKSQFINSLGKSLSIPERTLTTDKIRYDLSDFPIEFFDTPGHAERKFDRKKVLSEIIKDNFEGIINVVSYGYEENPEANRKAIFDANKNVKESFLKTNRGAELDRISEWLPHIDTTNIKWIINLVNKADLWWDRIDEVNSYYQNGVFNQAIRSINNTTNILTVPYCSLIQPYFDNSTSGKFGDLDKQNLHSNFVHQLLNLVKSK